MVKKLKFSNGYGLKNHYNWNKGKMKGETNFPTMQWQLKTHKLLFMAYFNCWHILIFIEVI